ncbi:MAG TPA: DinB family protein [Brevundimonas sp.]|jgi:hypothetical protein|uniref:DinB family protein n=1 Tax=Brevundimonas sp. TaxID=1871086 RepID=UPI002BA31700|nr:DinB family protein [Brevundimonas sp.]HRH19974.1 DinB family protein [Brevundimonas sp.]
MSEPLRDTLIRQLDTAWALATYHLDGLSDGECLWRPADEGLHIWADGQGGWRPDWPDHEGYDLGPPSIGWTTWHLLYWWSMALDRNFGPGILAREDVRWPGNAEALRRCLHDLNVAWRGRLGAIGDAELVAPRTSSWPRADQSLADVFAWANIELTKNAAELGYARFLFAIRKV